MAARFLQFAYRNRLLAKRAISLLDRTLPRPLARRLRQMAELAAFRMAPKYQGDTLPPIFHYWSERYVRPMLQARGFESPEDFYLKTPSSPTRSCTTSRTWKTRSPPSPRAWRRAACC